MIEFAIVLVVDRKLGDGHGESPKGQLFNNRKAVVQTEVSETTRNLQLDVLPLTQTKSRSQVEIIDFVALCVFMCSHIIYNCIYFAPFI